jgi:hypothetical protein
MKEKSTDRKTAPETVLVLRTVAADMSSSYGFTWPENGPVEASDWEPTKECGNGLHGWLWGAGDWSLKVQAEKIRWLVVEVAESSLIDLEGKVKFPKGNVVGCYETWHEAMAFIRARMPDDKFEKVATGYYGHASATGDYGHASATGDYGHASATGDYGHASATGYCGHASATGDCGHASATGDYGHASATGDCGHASATGNSGHASATGDCGWAVGGRDSRVRAGANGAITAIYWDGIRYRVVVGYVGEDGIEANTWYRIESGKFVKA